MTEEESGTVTREDLLEVTIELLDEATVADQGSFRAGVRAGWGVGYGLAHWLWRERVGEPVSVDGSATGRPMWTRGLDLADPHAVSRAAAAQLRAVASLLRRSSDLITGASGDAKDQNVAQAMSDTAGHVGISAEAVEHLVGYYLESLPPWQEQAPGPRRVSGPLCNWLAAYAIGATIAQHAEDEVVAELVTISRGDPAVLDAAGDRLATLASLDEEVRACADRMLRRGAARAREGATMGSI